MKKRTIQFVAAICALSLTGCSSLFGIATPPPPYPDGFTIVDGYGVDLSDPESIKAAYDRHMRSLLEADYVGNPAFSSQISEIVSAKPEWSRNFLNFQIVDYDMDNNILVYAYQTTLAVQDGEDYDAPAVEVAPIDYSIDTETKKKDKTLTKRDSKVKEEYGGAVSDDKKKLISAVGSYRWKDSDGKVLKESTIFWDTDVPSNKAVVSELGVGNKNLIVKLADDGQLAICYNDELLFYQYGDIPVDVTKDGKVTKETRKTYVPVTVKTGYGSEQKETALAFDIKSLKSAAKQDKYSGINNEIVTYDVTYKLDANDLETAKKNGTEAQLYHIMDEYVAGLDDKKAEAEWFRTYEKTLKVEYAADGKTTTAYVTASPDYSSYLLAALQEYAEEKQYDMTGAPNQDDHCVIDVAFVNNGETYHFEVYGRRSSVYAPVSKDQEITLTDLELYPLGDKNSSYQSAWKYTAVFQFRTEVKKSADDKTETAAESSTADSTEDSADYSVDEKVNEENPAFYTVAAATLGIKYASYTESNLSVIQITNDNEMKKAFEEERARIPLEIKSRKESFENEIKTGANVQVSERNVEDLSLILEKWEQVLELQKEIEGKSGQLKNKGETAGKASDSDAEEELSEEEEALKEEIEDLKEQILLVFEEITTAPRSVKITCNETVMFQPDKPETMVRTLTEEQVESLHKAAGLYERIQSAQSKIDTSFKAFMDAYHSASIPYYGTVLDNLSLKKQEMDDETKESFEFLFQSFSENFPESEKITDLSSLGDSKNLPAWLEQAEKSLTQVSGFAERFSYTPVKVVGDDGTEVEIDPYRDGYAVYHEKIMAMKEHLQVIAEQSEILLTAGKSLEELEPQIILERRDDLTFDNQQSILLKQCDRMQELISQVNRGANDNVRKEAKKELRETVWKIGLSPGIGDNSVIRVESEQLTRTVFITDVSIQKLDSLESVYKRSNPNYYLPSSSDEKAYSGKNPYIMNRISKSRVAITDGSTVALINFENMKPASSYPYKMGNLVEDACMGGGSGSTYFDQGAHETKCIVDINQLVGAELPRSFGEKSVYLMYSGTALADNKTGNNVYFEKGKTYVCVNSMGEQADSVYRLSDNNNSVMNRPFLEYTSSQTVEKKDQEKVNTNLGVKMDDLYKDAKATEQVKTDTEFLSQDHTILLPYRKVNDNSIYFLNISLQEGVVLYRYKKGYAPVGSKMEVVERITDKYPYKGGSMGGSYFRGWLQESKSGKDGYDLILLGFSKEDTLTEVNGVPEYRSIVPDDIYQAHLYKIFINKPK